MAKESQAESTAASNESEGFITPKQLETMISSIPEVRSLKDRQKSALVRALTVIYTQVFSVTHHSAWPDYEQIEAIDRIAPGKGQEILETVIAQSKHRMSLEKTVIGARERRAGLGQHYAFILGRVKVKA